MTGTITLQLTRAEAEALDALADNSFQRLFCDKSEAENYALERWSMQTAARACDKVRAALFKAEGEDLPDALTWSGYLQQQGI